MIAIIVARSMLSVVASAIWETPGFASTSHSTATCCCVSSSGASSSMKLR